MSPISLLLVIAVAAPPAFGQASSAVPPPCGLISPDDIKALRAGNAHVEESTYLSSLPGGPKSKRCRYQLRGENERLNLITVEVEPIPNAQAALGEDLKRLSPVWRTDVKITKTDRDGCTSMYTQSPTGSLAFCIGATDRFLVRVAWANPLVRDADDPALVLAVLRRVLSKVERHGG